ncbi:MAG: choice-of-anchor D domain-containing protein [Betaproteobacteria bacterium]|nr:choice-of-anchor D domain-containing protein [Betaproteobacteria bacterium]
MKRAMNWLAVIASLMLLAAHPHAHAIFTNGGFESSLPLDNSGPWKFEKGLSASLIGSEPYGAANLRLTPGGGNALTSRLGSVTVQNTSNVVQSPRLGSYSVIVNSNNAGSYGTGNNYNRIKQQDVITNGDRDAIDGQLHVRFAWAAALQAAGHGPSEQPYMFMQLRDVTLGTVLWQEFVYAGDPAKFFATGGGWFYTNWRNTDVVVPDSSLGHTLEIDVLAAGCSQGGHGGYVLFDAFGSAVVPPSGTIQLPTLHLSTTSLGYNTPTGVPAASQTVVVSNTGTADLQLGTFTISGANASDFSVSYGGAGQCNAGGIVAPGASCNLVVGFTPAATGAKFGWLTVTSNDTSGSVALQGNNGILTVTPASSDFGSVAMGGTSGTVTFTATNDGSSNLTLGSFNLSGANAASFAVTGGTCTTGATLAPAASCTITLTFSPAAGGAYSANLTVSSNATNESVALTGTGLAVANGACGAAHLVAVTSAPASLWCASGNAGAVSSANTSYDWTCDGIGGGSSVACYAPRQYAVSATIAAGSGTITPSQDVAYHAQPQFTVTPAAGYTLQSVTGCGGSLSGSVYTVAPVTAACTVSASFLANVAPVAQSVAIAPVGSGTPRYGDSVAGSYTYLDTDGDLQDVSGSGSAYRFVLSDDATLATAGDNVVVASGFTGGDTRSYVVPSGDVGKYLFYCVTPKAATGVASGAESCSVASAAVARAPQEIRYGPAPAVAVSGQARVSVVGGESGNPVVLASATPAVCAVTDTTLSGIAAGDCILRGGGRPLGGWGLRQRPRPAIAGAQVTGLAAGTCIIAADQAGNANHLDAPQATLAFAIGKGDQALTPAPIPQVVVGTSGTIGATGGASGNPVIFTNVTPSVCALAGNTVSGLQSGVCLIAADQAGNADWNDAPQLTLQVPVGRGAQVITLPPIPTITLGTGTTAHPTGGPSTAPVVLSSLTPSVCVVEGNAVRAIGPGACTVVATQGGDENYEAPVSVTRTVIIDRLDAQLALVANPVPANYRSRVTLAFEAKGSYREVTGAVAFHYGEDPIVGCGQVALREGRAECVTNRLPVGRRAVTARYGGDAYYKAGTAPAQAMVVRATNPGSRNRDVTGDGRTALFYETADGGLSIQTLNGRDRVPSDGQNLLPEGSRWHVTGFGNFDGDANPDVFLEHEDGRFRIVSLEGIGIVKRADFTDIPAGTKVLAFADFDGDGIDDLLVKRLDGSLAIAPMKAGRVEGNIEVTVPGDGIEFALVADFNGLGHADLVLRTPTGLRLQRIENGAAADYADLPMPGDGYALTHTGDFDGDGRTDLVFEDFKGHVMTWRLDGIALARQSVNPVPNGWKVTDVVDFDASFIDDLILVSPEGKVSVAYFAPDLASLSIGTLAEASDWKLWQVGDYDGDGFPDLLFTSDKGEVVAALYQQGLYKGEVVIHLPTLRWSVIP